MRLVDELRSRLQYKIILPFLILTLLVALAGASVSFLFVVGDAQERLDNQLAQVARTTSDLLVNQENANLSFLREIVFAQPNAGSGALAVADALAGADRAQVERALDPFFVVAPQRPGVRLDRLIAFDTAGRAILDWERSTDAEAPERVRHPGRDLSQLWFVPRVLGARQDTQGDKYAGLLTLEDGHRYMFTVAPVFQGDRVVGGIIVGTHLETLLQSLQRDSLAAIVTLYDTSDGAAFASTIEPEGGLKQLNVPPNVLKLTSDPQFGREDSIFDTASVNRRGYQFAYVPLRIRGAVIGLLSVALANDYVTLPWTAARGPLIALTVLVTLAIIGLGVLVARQITRPLEELASTAEAISAGNLERRSQVTAHDEIGSLSSSINNMTAHLLDLYRTVRTEASQRSAILESITDGVIVCDPEGGILLMNQAARVLLDLEEGQEGPARFGAIPLVLLPDNALAFGERTSRLYALGERFVRVASASVEDEGARLGDVYVLQDMTSEVAIDRAKTGFIATISHEMRTPLTVINGSSDLLARGLAGDLNDDQAMLVDSIRKHTQTLAALLNNVITIAGLDSGTLTFDLEPVNLRQVLDELLWQFRKVVAAKQLALNVDVPEDLPDLMVDAQQFRIALQQLLDNACRYTDHGHVSLSARLDGAQVRIVVADSGRGISADLSERLFTRFTRGADGINSAERGIGLGLAIAKELIERQGGNIQLDSTSEQGSTFSLTVPCAHATEEEHNKALASAA